MLKDIGYIKGDKCNRLICDGIIENNYYDRDRGCICFLGNPPCSYCTNEDYYCPKCDWCIEDDEVYWNRKIIIDKILNH